MPVTVHVEGGATATATVGVAPSISSTVDLEDVARYKRRPTLAPRPDTEEVRSTEPTASPHPITPRDCTLLRVAVGEGRKLSELASAYDITYAGVYHHVVGRCVCPAASPPRRRNATGDWVAVEGGGVEGDPDAHSAFDLHGDEYDV